MIDCIECTIRFGGEPIFEDLSWHIDSGARIGLIGPNGAGKTTLLRAICGELPLDGGRIATPNEHSIGYLPQEFSLPSTDRTVREEALQAFAHVHRVETEIEELTRRMDQSSDTESEAYQQMLHRLERLQQELVVHEAHRIEARTEAILSGLGFAAEEFDRPLHTFSGGWRMRVVLAKLLLRDHDALLLDEPTNHLDIESIDWFESYLQEYDGTVIMVSHDRHFLDRMIDSIAELSRGQISEYNGNYEYYLEERKRRREQQRAAYENQQQKIKEIQEFIDKFRYNASKAAQVQSRIKKLEKMERIPPPPPEEPSVNFEFPDPPRSGEVVMRISEFSKTYSNENSDLTRVFDDAGPLHVDRGDKIALIGANGVGKSTLARIILGTEPFDGTREEGHNVLLTHFAQHQAEALSPEHTVFEEARDAAADHNRTRIRSMLGAFLFTGDDVFKNVRVLSGGEKSRLALAKTLLSPANFFMLDEPTNHLDISSRNVLIEALEQFSGTYIVISHDRHFLEQTTNRVWHIRRDGTITTYPGGYADYEWSLEQGVLREEGASTDEGEETADDTADDRTSGPKSKAQKRREARERNRRYREQQEKGDRELDSLNTYQLRQELEQVEEQIFEAEDHQESLEQELGDPSLYNKGDEASNAVQEYNDVKSTLTELYDRWERIAERLAVQSET
jgi:ATP-binding cassette subfamily F protein 3